MEQAACCECGKKLEQKSLPLVCDHCLSKSEE